MDYCEIILESVHKVVTAEMAKERYASSGSLVVAQVLEDRGVSGQTHTFLAQEEGGRRLEISASTSFIINLNDYVYIIGNTVVAKKLDSGQVPIEVNESLKDFIPSWTDTFMGENKSRNINEERVFNRLLIETVVANDSGTDPSYLINIHLTNENGIVYGINFSEIDLVGMRGRLANSLQKQMYSLDLGKIVSISVNCDSSVYKQVSVSLGNNAESLKDEMGLALSIEEEKLEYQTGTDGKVIGCSFTPSWIWLYVDENEKLNQFTSGKTVNYYRYNETYNNGDEYGGLNWEKISLDAEGKINQDQFLPVAASTRIKAVLIEGQTIVTSNEIEFNNIILTREGIISNMSLKFSDGRNGVYPFYSPSGALLRQFSNEANKPRTVEFTYLNSDATRYDIDKLVKSAIWTIDLDKIEIAESILNDTNIVSEGVKLDSNGNAILTLDTTKRIIETKNDKGEVTSTVPGWNKFDFFIKSRIEMRGQGLEDLITCTVTLEGDREPYVASVPLSFTLDSTGNSGYSVSLELEESVGKKICYSADIDKNYNLLCSIWDQNGNQLIAGTDYIINNCTWYGHHKPSGSNPHNRAFILANNNKEHIKIIKRNSSDRNGWTSASHIINIGITIIKDKDKNNIEDTNKGIVINILYPLAVHSAGLDLYYNGPTEFQYTVSGKPVEGTSTNENFYFTNRNGEKEQGSDIICRYSDNQWSFTNSMKITTTPVMFAGFWHPIIEQRRVENYYIIAPNCFDSSINDKGNSDYLFNIVRYNSEDDKYFSQPIILYQNTKFSSYVDNWGGELTIDEKSNRILSASIVAGKKNNQNQFTGVMIGDVGTIQDNGEQSITDSGILGFEKGAPSFGLNTNGTAFFGKTGSGQINFDGNGGLIQSGAASWENTDKIFTSQGMIIDLDEEYGPNNAKQKSGGIHTKNFAVKADGTVLIRNGDFGGQKIENNYWIDANREGRVNYIKSGHIPIKTLLRGTNGYIYQHNMAGIKTLGTGTYTVTVNAELTNNPVQVKVFAGDGTEEGYQELLLDENGVPPFLDKDKNIQFFYFELTEEIKRVAQSLSVMFYCENGSGGTINWVMLTHNTSQYNELLFPADYDVSRNENLLSVTDAFKRQNNIPNSNLLGIYSIRDSGLEKLKTLASSGQEHLTVTLKGDLNSLRIKQIGFAFGEVKETYWGNTEFSKAATIVLDGKYYGVKNEIVFNDYWKQNKDNAHIWNSEYYIFDLNFDSSQRTGLVNWLNNNERKNVYFLVYQYGVGGIPYLYQSAALQAAKLEIGPRPTHIDPSMDVVEDWAYIPPEEDKTTITGGRVDTYLINANRIRVDNIQSSNLAGYSETGGYTQAGTYIDLLNGAIHSKNFYIDNGGNANFKGHVVASSGKIANWKIASNTLKSLKADGTTTHIFGEADSFVLQTKGNNGGYFTIAGRSRNDWRLGIGENFGITADGSLYANAGRIGGFDIVDGQMKLAPGGTNLALNSYKKVTSESYHLTGYYIDAIEAENQSDAKFKLGQKVYHLIPGKKYTVRIDLTIEKTTDKDTNFIGLYCGDSSTPLSWSGYGPNSKHDKIEGVLGGGSWFPLSNAGENGRAITEFSFTVYSGLNFNSEDRWQVYLYQRCNFLEEYNAEEKKYIDRGSSKNKITIHRIKIEEGTISTGWSLAPGDSVSSEQTSGTIKWEMLEDEMKWWTNDIDSPLLSVNSTGLTIKGQVEATSGTLGESDNTPWHIGADGVGGINRTYLHTGARTGLYHGEPGIYIGEEGMSFRPYNGRFSGESLVFNNEYGTLVLGGTLIANGIDIDGKIDFSHYYETYGFDPGSGSVNTSTVKVRGGPEPLQFDNIAQCIGNRELKNKLPETTLKQAQVHSTISKTIYAKSGLDSIFNNYEYTLIHRVNIPITSESFPYEIPSDANITLKQISPITGILYWKKGLQQVTKIASMSAITLEPVINQEQKTINYVNVKVTFTVTKPIAMPADTYLRIDGALRLDFSYATTTDTIYTYKSAILINDMNEVAFLNLSEGALTRLKEQLAAI